MKTAAAIFALAGLMIAPIACVIVVCPVLDTHDCCPQSKSFAACPFDILASAKAALPAVITAVFNNITIAIAEPSFVPVPSFAADDRDLHLHNRVLRI